MKRIGVAGIITGGDKHPFHILLGRRGKDPNRGLFVLPGGGVEDGESLEDAFCREVYEETGLRIKRDDKRWAWRPWLIELPDRIVLVEHATAEDNEPRDGSDLYDVQWVPYNELPADVSPVVKPVLARWGWHTGRKPE